MGKKSWNVYNTTNIERVKRDEEAAAALEAEKERRMQEIDAERRLNILRGSAADGEALPVSEANTATKSRHEAGLRRDSKRRRIASEDDTERDLRLAVENRERQSKAVDQKRMPSSNAPLVDGTGHISLFPVAGSRNRNTKNAEVEAEAAKKKKAYEDQYTMRFSNATGIGQSMDRTPWYHKGAAEVDTTKDVVGKNVWGDENAGRKEHDQRRIMADDPLAMIQKGVRELRQVEKERQKWKEDRDRELRKAVHRQKRKAKACNKDDEDDLENFSLDSAALASPGYELRGRDDSSHRDRKRRRHSRTMPRYEADNGWRAGPSGRHKNPFENTTR